MARSDVVDISTFNDPEIVIVAVRGDMAKRAKLSDLLPDAFAIGK